MLRSLMAMGILAWTFLGVLHFIPTIIGFCRGKRDAIAIAALNLFLGWTIVGWVGALIWALVGDSPKRLSETYQVTFCGNCGARLTGAFCGSCGASRSATRQTA